MKGVKSSLVSMEVVFQIIYPVGTFIFSRCLVECAQGLENCVASHQAWLRTFCKSRNPCLFTHFKKLYRRQDNLGCSHQLLGSLSHSNFLRFYDLTLHSCCSRVRGSDKIRIKVKNARIVRHGPTGRCFCKYFIGCFCLLPWVNWPPSCVTTSSPIYWPQLFCGMQNI